VDAKILCVVVGFQFTFQLNWLQSVLTSSDKGKRNRIHF